MHLHATLSNMATIDKAVLYLWSTGGMLQSLLGIDPSTGILSGSFVKYQYRQTIL